MVRYELLVIPDEDPVAALDEDAADEEVISEVADVADESDVAEWEETAELIEDRLPIITPPFEVDTPPLPSPPNDRGTPLRPFVGDADPGLVRRGAVAPGPKAAGVGVGETARFAWMVPELSEVVELEALLLPEGDPNVP